MIRHKTIIKGLIIVLLLLFSLPLISFWNSGDIQAAGEITLETPPVVIPSELERDITVTLNWSYDETVHQNLQSFEVYIDGVFNKTVPGNELSTTITLPSVTQNYIVQIVGFEFDPATGTTRFIDSNNINLVVSSTEIGIQTKQSADVIEEGESLVLSWVYSGNTDNINKTRVIIDENKNFIANGNTFTVDSTLNLSIGQHIWFVQAINDNGIEEKILKQSEKKSFTIKTEDDMQITDPTPAEDIEDRTVEEVEAVTQLDSSPFENISSFISDTIDNASSRISGVVNNLRSPQINLDLTSDVELREVVLLLIPTLLALLIVVGIEIFAEGITATEQSINTFISKYIRRKKDNKRYGVIFDARSGKPVELAHVSIIQGDDTFARATTDLQGRYSLNLESTGNLFLKVSADDYEDFYYGFYVDNFADNAVFNKDVALKHKDDDGITIAELIWLLKVNLQKFVKPILTFVSAVGFMIALAFAIQNPSLFSYLMVLIYIGFITLSLLSYLENIQKNVGVIYDSEDKKPMQGVSMRIFDDEGAETHSLITNQDGEIWVRLRPGEYKTKIYKPEYRLVGGTGRHGDMVKINVMKNGKIKEELKLERDTDFDPARDYGERRVQVDEKGNLVAPKVEEDTSDPKAMFGKYRGVAATERQLEEEAKKEQTVAKESGPVSFTSKYRTVDTKLIDESREKKQARIEKEKAKAKKEKTVETDPKAMFGKYESTPEQVAAAKERDRIERQEAKRKKKEGDGEEAKKKGLFSFLKREKKEEATSVKARKKDEDLLTKYKTKRVKKTDEPVEAISSSAGEAGNRPQNDKPVDADPKTLFAKYKSTGGAGSASNGVEKTSEEKDSEARDNESDEEKKEKPKKKSKPPAPPKSADPKALFSKYKPKAA